MKMRGTGAAATCRAGPPVGRHRIGHVREVA